ncbi:MAG TPA: hypothetical protein VE988_12185, partial [Gemmataceae bacterium]|nr:hypothetical protein [Gemmataceae bacterium]
MKINVFGDIPGLLCLARSSKWAIPTLAVAGLVLLSASPSLAQPQQPPQAEEKPELKTYALKSNGAKKHVVALEAIYKPSASLKIIAIDDKQIMVYATPKIQTEIRERLKGDLLSDQQKKAIDQQKKAIDALDALVKQMREGKKETPPNLEESLAKALKQNPDLLVSAAKVHEAEAELNRVRLSGVAKLAIALVDYERTDAILDESTRKLDRLTQLRQQKGTSVVTDEELGAARATVEKYKAQKAQNKAALNQDALKADLAVAEAKVHLAQAELNVVRQRILGKIAVIYSELEADRAVLKEMETKLERVKAIYSKGAASITEFADTQLAVDDYKAKLAKKEA